MLIFPETLDYRDLTYEDISAFYSLRLDKKLTIITVETGRAIGLKGFIKTLVIFVRKNQTKFKKKQVLDNNRDIYKLDSSWVYDYPI
jgi:uncharacterized UPF0146 family protein